MNPARWIVLAALVAWPLTVQADQAPPVNKYSWSPWRASFQEVSVVGTDTLTTTVRVWVDEGAREKAGEVKTIGWDRTQETMRNICIFCAPTSWENTTPGTLDRIQMALQTKEQHPQYLQNLSFMIVNISVSGDIPKNGWPLWRIDPKDGITLTLSDGRTMTSLRRQEIKPPHITIWRRMSQGMEETCWQLKRTLSWHGLYPRAELERRWGDLSYPDKPEENVFLVLFNHGHQPFRFRDIKTVSIHLMGRDVSLQQPSEIAQRASGQ